MKLTFTSKERDIRDFLERVREKLTNEGEEGLLFKQNRFHEKDNVKYTNQYCIDQLEYDVEDVIHEIMTLEVSHCLESLNDRKSSQLDLLRVYQRNSESAGVDKNQNKGAG